jgi:NAD-dependent dihydropyrimidine dehydrogenase PreA subunit
MKIMRKIIEIDENLCNGCGQCIPACAEGALEIVDGKARMIAEIYCDGLGACLGDCPTGALRIVEREAEDFDEDAVEELLEAKEKGEKTTQPSPPSGGCPSARLQTFTPSTPCQAANKPVSHTVSAAPSQSALTHWPVQIRLVPPTAPFLKNAALLIAADCTPIAYPHFHRDFLQGKTVMAGCPKFDDTESYIQKFADIFKKANIKSITNVIMEVPCCASMRTIITKAMEQAGVKIDVEEVVISARGEILHRGKMTA